jgi:hypothetical protein
VGAAETEGPEAGALEAGVTAAGVKVARAKVGVATVALKEAVAGPAGAAAKAASSATEPVAAPGRAGQRGLPRVARAQALAPAQDLRRPGRHRPRRRRMP